MTKISRNVVDRIDEIIKTAQLANIDALIIEPKLIRGINEQKSAVLIEATNVIDVPAPTALSRLSTFLSRYDAAKTQEKLEIEVDVDTGNKFVRTFTFKSDRLKIEYRCASPENVTAPKQVNDAAIYRVEMPAEAVVFLQKAQGAMGGENVSFVYDGKEVYFEMVDVGGDPFKYIFTTDIVPIGSAKAIKPFTFKYPFKIIHALLKNNANSYVEFGQKGVMSVIANKLTFYILPVI